MISNYYNVFVEKEDDNDKKEVDKNACDKK